MRTRLPTLVRLFGVPLVSIVACNAQVGVGGDSGWDTGSFEPLELQAGATVRYLGNFDWDDAIEVDGSYVFSSDLGFRYRIDAFMVATTTVQLRPCDAGDTAWLRVGFTDARADHVVSDDESMVVTDMAEDAMSTTTIVLGQGTADGGSYCQGFLLSSVPTQWTAGLENNTLSMSGAYLDPDADGSDPDAWVLFQAEIPLNDGSLEDLVPAAGDLYTEDGGADVDVRFTRYPARAFDGLDPGALNTYELAWEVLGNLLHGSALHYRAR